MSDDLITLEVDGEEVKARRGQMIIEVTDAANRYVPRFCYHEKLSIAANCRMCLVEVEKAPKPLPACATPVGEGMKIFTRSPYAIAAQKATMEFLLINHPLDCPICDQGGECELQDLAMGYGRDVSRYTDRKRVVADKNIGPLVSTDMTRCIHCTRCVRFGQEIAGIQELGTTDRGENMKIGTFIEKSVDHELSGNIIDLCPVGALNNKPYRYSARAWEMTQMPSVSAHDCVGSNLFAHVLRGTVKRVVPRQNEAINETWISDRDRFSYEGIYATDRLQTPAIRNAQGDWEDVSWEAALTHAVDILKAADADQTGCFVSPGATVEEAFLWQTLAAEIGVRNIDYRLRRADFVAAAGEPLIPNLGMRIADLERQQAILLIGSDIRNEAPILAHRVRKAAVAGATVGSIDTAERQYRFDIAPLTGELLDRVARLAKAAGVDTTSLPKSLHSLVADAAPDAVDQTMAQALADGEHAALVIGLEGLRHPAYSALASLANAIAHKTNATLGTLSEGPNSAGAAICGLLPDRELGGKPRSKPGLDAAAMAAAKLRTYVLFQAEPASDFSETADIGAALANADNVIAMTSYDSAELRSTASVLLPVGTFAETAGTFINIEGTWQSFKGIANPVAEARPGWKVLRVLLNQLGRDDVAYMDCHEVLEAARAAIGDPEWHDRSETGATDVTIARANGSAARLSVPIYEVDSVVRRATALQRTTAGLAGQAWRPRGGDDA